MKGTRTQKSVWRTRLAASKYLYLLLAPCLLSYLIFNYAPMFGILVSFKDYNIFRGFMESPWVGFKYYEMFFSAPDFYRTMRNTVLLGFYALVFPFPAPIILALLINEVKNMFFKRFVQSVSYLPHFISNVIVASMITFMLSPSGGPINVLLGKFGIGPINFLMDPGWFRTIYVASDIWQYAGFSAIIYLAALTAIDPHLYEAAEMDGANRWKQTIHVTLPGISSTIFIMLILSFGQILQVGFEKVYLLYNPSTYETADTIQTYVYRMGLIGGNYSYATAVGLFLSVISAVFLIGANYFAAKMGKTSLW